PYRNPRSRADIARGIPASEDSPQQEIAAEEDFEPTPTDEPELSSPHAATAPTQQPTAAPGAEPATGTRTAEDFERDADYYASRAERQGRSLREHRTRATHELANVIFVASGKGGTGKSTTALQLAHYASEISREEGAGLK